MGIFCLNGDGPAGNGPDRNIARGLKILLKQQKNLPSKYVHQRVCLEPGESSNLLVTLRRLKVFQSIKSLQFPACFDWGPKFPW